MSSVSTADATPFLPKRKSLKSLRVTATVHPSAILRAPDDEARQVERRAFTRDLQTVADFLARTPASAGRSG